MPSFFERESPGIAVVYFHGSAPPPDGAFARLRDRGIEITPTTRPNAIWSLDLVHPEWGTAELMCVRDHPPVEDYTRFAINLTDAEKRAASDANSAVMLSVPAKRKNVLHDRKRMLRFAEAVLGDDGVLVVDLATTLPWSRASLADELAHDADLDIEAIYCIHDVTPDDGASSAWLHTHGLGEIGSFDFDVVRPSREFVANCAEPFRAIAFQVLDGQISMSEAHVPIGNAFEARFVPASEFMRDADPSDRAARDSAPDDHLDRRSVICEPTRRRLFGRGGDRPQPHRLPQSASMPDGSVLYFTALANELMADRARHTIHLLPELAAEFAEFEPGAVVKIGYPTDDGRSREHLWFEFHGLADGEIDATLQSEPYEVSSLTPGVRARHPADWLSDWILIGPTGWVTPRSQAAARRLRENATEIRAAIAASRGAN